VAEPAGPLVGALDDRALARLETDLNGWITTVRADGQPQSSLVWFLWDDGIIWVRSQVQAAKLRNLGGAAPVAFSLNSNDIGGDVVTLEARAEVVDKLPARCEEGYLAKYGDRIREGLGMSDAELLASFPVIIRLAVTRARAW
jgi:PPOX class probable F420-dependent enzyme